jgi:transposase
VRRWAVEGATGLGHTVAQQLLATGETVLDVPAKLTARARVLGTGNARKTDAADAASAATVAIHNRRLRQVTSEDPNVVLRLLTCRREDLVAERTRTVNRLHVLLRDLHPGGAKRALSATHAASCWPACNRSPWSTPTEPASPASSWPASAAWTPSSRPTRPRSARQSAPATPP